MPEQPLPDVDFSAQPETRARRPVTGLPLVDRADAYRAALNALDDGWCLMQMLYDQAGRPVDYRFIEVNPAFERHTGLRGAAGRTALELVPNLEHDWIQIYAAVARSGESLHYSYPSEAVDRWFTLQAAPFGAPEERIVALVFRDVSQTRRSQRAVQGAARANAFRVRLADALRPLTDEAQIRLRTARLLGRHLGATRVYYASFGADQQTFTVQHDYHHGVPAMPPRLRLDAYGAPFAAQVRAGRLVRFADILRDPLADSDAARAAYAALEIRAAVAVPLIKHGALALGLVVIQRSPRTWTEEEVTLIQDVAERSWSAIQRARAEQARRASDFRLRAVFEGSIDFIGLMDPDGTVIEANPASVAFAGVPREALVGKPVWEAHWFRDRPDTQAELKQAVTRAAAGEFLRWDFSARDGDGALREFDFSLHPVRDDAGKVVWLVPEARDISERKAAQEALRASEERLVRAVNVGSVGVFFEAPDGRIPVANDAFLAQVGYSRAELEAGRVRWDELTPPEWLATARKARKELETSGQIHPYEKEYFRKDGSRWRGLFAGNAVGAGETAKFVIDITEQHRERQRSQDFQERLRLAAQTARLYSWEIDCADLSISFSDNAAEVLGFGMLPRDTDGLSTIVHQADRERVAAEFRNAVARADNYSLQYRVVSHTGDVVWLETHGHIQRGAEGKALRIVGIAQNVTARKRTETWLADQRQAMALIAADKPLGEVLDFLCRAVERGSPTRVRCAANLLEADGANLSWQAAPSLRVLFEAGGRFSASEQASGCGAAIARGEPVFIPELEAEPLAAGYAAVLRRAGVRACFSVPIRSGAGTILGTVCAFYRQPGLPGDEDLGMAESAASIAALAIEHQQLEAGRRNNLAVQRRLSELANAANAAPGLRHNLEMIAAAARELVNANLASADMVLNADWADAVTCTSLSDKYAAFGGYDEAPRGEGIYRLVCEHNAPVRLTHEQLLAHPRWRGYGGEQDRHPPLRGWLAVPFTGRNGKNLGLLQVSDREDGEFSEQDEVVLGQLAHIGAMAIEGSRLVEALREADLRKDEFLATLAHELRNPLAPLRSGLEILEYGHKAGADDSALADTRAMMARQLRQMARMVDDLLDVSRITRGKIELRREALDLGALVRQAADDGRAFAESLGHRLACTVPAAAVTVEGDRARLAQVVANLLNNACKYTGEGGEIAVSLWLEGDRAHIAVRDNGMGIAADKLESVFEMFSQIDPPAETVHGGLGIGLTLVRQLLRLHGGEVGVTSAGLGRGTEFTVHLPLPQQAVVLPAGAASPSPRPRPGPRRRILVADDNADAAEALARVLALAGHQVEVAGDGVAALEAAARFRPQAVLLDLGMPRMGGLDAARRLRATAGGKDLLLIAISGWGQEGDRRRSREAGFDHHLVKPIDAAALEDLLGKFKEKS